MNEETLKRLDTLAAKLNTTGEHLWGVLMVQQRVDAAIKFMLFGFGLYLIHWAIKCFKLEAKQEYDDPKYVLIGVCCGGFGVMFVGFGFDWWGHIINPEFYAIKSLLVAMKD